MTPRTPSPRVAGLTAYKVPGTLAPIDLDLRGNEGSRAGCALFAPTSDDLRRYPDARPLQDTLADRYGVGPERVIVTAGGDDALDRLCRAVLAPGREVILPVPGFEMTERYAHLAGATPVRVPWDGSPFPLEQALAAVTAATALVVVTSPNNPTGRVATTEQVEELSAVAPGAVILVDLAYVEYADDDPSAAVLALPNVVVVRTFSKAWGLAGLRVGYAIGPADVIGWMRATGAPYAVSAASMRAATCRLGQHDAVLAHVAEVRAERAAIEADLAELGAEVLPSSANFAFARVPDAEWLRDALAGLGIGIRTFPGRPELDGGVRIGCPADGAGLARLRNGLRAVLAPEAVVLDLDGVLADVSKSYRRAIVETAARFGVALTPEDVSERKRQGDANNDWEVTHDLLRARGVDPGLPAVIEAFEALYQGTSDAPGLRGAETLLVLPSTLDALAARWPLAIVTGRPRADAERFLDLFGVRARFLALVCLEDGPKKPDPWPVAESLRRLGVATGVYVGDTVDDVRAARAAGLVPLGIVAPGEDPETAADALLRAGAARVLDRVHQLLELLP